MTKPPYTISIICHNRLGLTGRALNSVRLHSPDAAQIIVTDNGSSDGTAAYLANLARADPRIEIVTNAPNLGVGAPKRRALELARAPLFVSLDNDAWVGPGWLDALRRPLDSDPRIMQVGRKGTHQTLGSNGVGFPGPTLDYIDGSCFMTRTAMAREIGIADRYFPFAYGEDADYSLRLRARGYLIDTLDLQVWHPDEGGKDGHGGVDVGQHLRVASELFCRRWGSYLTRRAFDATVLIRRTASLGDVVLATPLPRLIHELWPTARVFVATRFPEVFSGNPHVEEILPAEEFDRRKHGMAYAWDLDMAYEQDLASHYWDSYARRAVFAAGEPRPAPELYPTEEARAEAEGLVPMNGKPLAIVAAEPTSWDGKNLGPSAWTIVLRGLRSRGYMTVEVGTGAGAVAGEVDYPLAGRTRFSVLAALLGRARLYVGLEQGAFHVAEAMGAASAVFFGCTSPAKVASVPARLQPILAEGLDCLGCHHRQPTTTRFMGCARGDFACRGIPLSAFDGAVDRAEAAAIAGGR